VQHCPKSTQTREIGSQAILCRSKTLYANNHDKTSNASTKTQTRKQVKWNGLALKRSPQKTSTGKCQQRTLALVNFKEKQSLKTAIFRQLRNLQIRTPGRYPRSKFHAQQSHFGTPKISFAKAIYDSIFSFKQENLPSLEVFFKKKIKIRDFLRKIGKKNLNFSCYFVM